MGRPKKSDPKIFVAAVEQALAKGAPSDNLVNIVCRQIKAGNTPIIQRVLEMKYGKPVQPTEITGKDGNDLKIIIEHITA